MDGEREKDAHRELHGIHKEIRYLHLRNKYAVSLLGSRIERLPAGIEAAYAEWLWSRELGYLDVPLREPPFGRTASAMERWFVSHEILSCYPTVRALAAETIGGLCARRNRRGLRDLGGRDPDSAYFPLSDTRTMKAAREQDWSTRVLVLM